MNALGTIMQALAALMILTGLIFAATGVGAVPVITLGVAGAATLAAGSFSIMRKGFLRLL